MLNGFSMGATGLYMELWSFYRGFTTGLQCGIYTSSISGKQGFYCRVSKDLLGSEVLLRGLQMGSTKACIV